MKALIDTIICGDSESGLKKLPDACINCCVTSPPYWGLRDYGHAEQIGLEESPEMYIERLVLVFREVRRVLKDNGTLWLNIGDSYMGNGGQDGAAKSTLQGASQNAKQVGAAARFVKKSPDYKPKDLIGIPWMLAFALRADGWYLRQDIIWSKPNPMPESVTDRCTKAHEYIFLLSKSPKYYFDHEAIKTPAKDPVDDARRFEAQSWDNKNTPDNLRNGIRPKRGSTFGNRGGELKGLHSGNAYQPLEKANKRSVWTVNTMPYKEAHFATFPERLIVDCIKAGCPIGGVVLDPFMGAGTTAVVAKKLMRNFIGIEINPKYVEMAEKRIRSEIGLFMTP